MFPPFSVTGCSLELLKPGEQGIVAFCKIPNQKRSQELIAMGIKEGTRITVKETFPALKIEFNNLTLSIDKKIACTIYLRIIDS
ncbi:MAG: ferrous iron transport protein A [Aulosira sp. DedQUE10]|nr:ferrous iron transport protein A [Aulosira sp. DedQUE10]